MMEESGTAAGNGHGRLALYVVVIYAGLVLLGAIGEVFGVEWIKAIPLFRGP